MADCVMGRANAAVIITTATTKTNSTSVKPKLDEIRLGGCATARRFSSARRSRAVSRTVAFNFVAFIFVVFTVIESHRGAQNHSQILDAATWNDPIPAYVSNCQTTRNKFP